MKGVHGENLFKLLESRVDNLVYRIGFATTRRGARQLVNHGHITVNGKKVNIPSYRCKPGDVIAIKESDKELKIVKASLETISKRVDFINYDESKMALVAVINLDIFSYNSACISNILIAACRFLKASLTTLMS